MAMQGCRSEMQQKVEEVGSGEGGFCSTEFCGIVAHLRRHIVHGTTEGLVTESTFLVGSQECVNSMDILLVDILMVDISKPGTVHTHYLT